MADHYTGKVFEVDVSKCLSCYACAELCQGGAFFQEVIADVAQFDAASCICCGQCETIVADCPAGAIRELTTNGDSV